MFYGLSAVETINGIENLDVSRVTNMSYMFSGLGVYNYNNSNNPFTLDLGDNFDTSNVTDMSFMFFNTGSGLTNFTLDLGSDFDTSKVTNMSNMFYLAGHSSTNFTLGLGDKFDTSNVTDMSFMFGNTGHSSTIFTLDLGDKFDTSKVTDMSYMFSGTGYGNLGFSLDLGDKFDTSNVTNMSYMFYQTGYSSQIFTLDLGDNFDTSKVTDMSTMFYKIGNNNANFTLILGDKFDTSNVINMSAMFYEIGNGNTNFILDLGDNFNTSNVTDMSAMFAESYTLTTIYAPSSFVTTNVIDSVEMFNLDNNLVGGMGTTFDSNHVDAVYAHIDGGQSNPGYFSDRAVYAQQLAKKARVKDVANIGRKVNFVSNYSNDLIWRLFYADDDYVYLISSKLYVDGDDSYEKEAQRTNYGGLGGVGLISQQNTSYSGSESITDPFLRSLNSLWYEYLSDEDNAQYRTSENAKATAWFMDQSRWASWKDSAGVAQYAIGGPTMELLVKSFNATAASNSQTTLSLYISNGGYDPSPDTGNSLLNTYNYGIYHLRGSTDSFWLASPGGNNLVDPGLRVRTSGGNGVRPYGIHFGQTGYNLGLRPVVILPLNSYILSSYDIIAE